MTVEPTDAQIVAVARASCREKRCICFGPWVKRNGVKLKPRCDRAGRAAITALVPPGFAVRRREPTVEMVLQGLKVVVELRPDGIKSFRDVWIAMFDGWRGKLAAYDAAELCEQNAGVYITEERKRAEAIEIDLRTTMGTVQRIWVALGYPNYDPPAAVADEISELVRKLKVRAEAAEAKLHETTEWRPIETAPREEGSTIIVGRGGGQLRERYSATGRWDKMFERFDAEWGSYRLAPTHWLPLPAPPGGSDTTTCDKT